MEKGKLLKTKEEIKEAIKNMNSEEIIKDIVTLYQNQENIYFDYKIYTKNEVPNSSL